MAQTRLSKAVQAAVAAGASATVILALFLGPQEGTALTAYQDAGKTWTICKGHTAGVRPGQTATTKQCDDFFKSDIGIAFVAVDRIVKVSMSEPERAGVTSFCAYSIGPGACATTTFIKKLNAGDRVGACNEIPKFHFVKKIDCSAPGNKTCSGILDRRAQERELCLLD